MKDQPTDARVSMRSSAFDATENLAATAAAVLSVRETRASVANRFDRALSWREAAVGMTGTLLATSLLLSPPLAAHLFGLAADGLPDGVAGVVGYAQLLAIIVGVVTLSTAIAPHLADRRLPCRRGTAVAAALLAAGGVLSVELGLRVSEKLRWGSWLALPLPTATMWAPDRVHLRPGVYVATVESEFGSYRAEARYTVNRYGLRGAMPAAHPSADVVRIVALGGSSTFGWHVTDGADWPSRLAAHLGRQHRVEVLNAGRPGATTYGDFYYLRDRLLQLQPGVVVLYEGFNDLWRGVRLQTAPQPDYGVVESRLPAAPEPLDLGPPRPWPPRMSFLAAKVGMLLHERFAFPGQGLPRRLAMRRISSSVVGVYEKNLAALIRLAHRRGAAVVVVTFAAADQRSLPWPERLRRLRYAIEAAPAIPAREVESLVRRYRRRTRVVARRDGALVVDAASSLHDLDYFTDTIHFTPQGEEALARTIAETPDFAALIARLPSSPREPRPRGSGPESTPGRSVAAGETARGG